MTNPTVCVDCSPLLVRSAGVKTYLYHLVRAMQTASPESVKTFLSPRDLEHLDHDGGPAVHFGKLALLGALSRLPDAFTSIAVPKCDIFHCSNLLRKAPHSALVTATLHDLTPWTLPECHKPGVVQAEREFADRILRSAAGILTVSENSRNDAVRILGLAPERIRVVYPGVAEAYFAAGPEQAEVAAHKLGLRKPYFLCVGTIEPRKNVDVLLDAWLEARKRLGDDYELVIAGMGGWRTEATVRRLEEQNRGGGVRYLGYVAEDDMPGLTAGAFAFVYPSLYEGFGIPVAQAMAAGRAIITSNVSSLPEITAGAALLIDPKSPGDLAVAMTRVTQDTALRCGLGARAFLAGQQYRWDRAAFEALSFYVDVFSAH